MPEPDTEVVHDTAARGRRQRWVMLAVFAGLLLVLFIVFQVWVEREFEYRLESLRAKGEPTNYQELDALRGPPPPEGENSAAAYEMAYSRFSLATEDSSNPALPMFGDYAQGILPGDPYTDEELDTASRFLEKNDAVLTLLDAADKVVLYYRPMQLSPDGDWIMTGLEMSIRLAELRVLQSRIALELGDTDGSLAAIRGAAMLERRLVAENQDLTVYLVRIAILALVADTVERIASRAALSDTQLEDLIQMLDSAYDPKALLTAMVAERAYNLFIGEKCLDPSNDWSQVVFGDGWLGRLATVAYSGSGLGCLDRGIGLDYMTALCTAVELPLPARLEATRKVDYRDYFGGVQSLYSHISGRHMPSLGRVSVREAKTVAKLRSATAALAVERYRLADGKLPDSLEELVPRFLQALPEDPFTGKPLVYRKDGMGFTVYSLGDGGTDDGGIPAAPEVEEGSPGTDIPFRVRR